MICISINLKQCWRRSCGLRLCVMWSHLGKEKFIIRHVSMWVGFLGGCVCSVMSWYWWGVTEAYFDRSLHSWHCDQIPHHSVYMSQCTYPLLSVLTIMWPFKLHCLHVCCFSVIAPSLEWVRVWCASKQVFLLSVGKCCDQHQVSVISMKTSTIMTRRVCSRENYQ